MKGFVKHLFPQVVLRQNLKITYTFCLGGLAFTSLLVLTVSGLLLLFYYQPVPSHAFASILFLEERIFGGSYLRALHRLASHSLLILMFLHTMRVILTGAYRKPRELNWIIGFVILCLVLFTAYTGYLLPLDQLALWATRTGMELLAIPPGGGLVRSLLFPDGIDGPFTLLRFYVLHIALLPLLIFLLVALHFYRIRKNKGVLPYL